MTSRYLFSAEFQLNRQKLVEKLNLNVTKHTFLENAISQRHIHLWNRKLDDEDAHLVALVITHWPGQQPLHELRLRKCSMSQSAWKSVLPSLSRCQHLTYLDLSRSSFGDAEHQLALILLWSLLWKVAQTVTESIRSRGDKPPLKELTLFNCSLTSPALIELVQSLTTCKHLTKLCLSKNKLGEVGHQLAQSIRSLGDEPPLHELWLYNCSLTEAASLELVQSLSKCKKLTSLDLGQNSLAEAGHQLAQSIRSWGDEPPLHELWLYNCSLTEAASLELVQSLSKCKQLTKLNLSKNKLDEAGYQLVQSIRSWGDEPPLQKLWLHNCSLTATASLDLVQSLATCKHLTNLSLSENKLGEAGHQLAESIKSWGDEPPLQDLWISNCSLTATASLELVQSLATCKHLTVLSLNENKLGEAGHELAQLTRSWGDEPPLQDLWISNSSLTTTASLELVQSLATCKKCVHLDLSENKLGESGYQLAQSIRSWGDEPPLQQLFLSNCLLTSTASFELVQSLATCKHLTHLDLSENKLGEAGHQLAQSIRSWGDNLPLQWLELHNCSLTTTASLELVQSLLTCKHLTCLDLRKNKLGEAGYQLAQSIRSWGDEPPLQTLYLDHCSIPVAATLELIQSLLMCTHLETVSLLGNEFDDRGYDLAQSLRSLLQYLNLPDKNSMTAVQYEPQVVGREKGFRIMMRKEKIPTPSII